MNASGNYPFEVSEEQGSETFKLDDIVILVKGRTWLKANASTFAAGTPVIAYFLSENQLFKYYNSHCQTVNEFYDQVRQLKEWNDRKGAIRIQSDPRILLRWS